MGKLLAINGSPRGKKGNTQKILNALIEGIGAAGESVEMAFLQPLDL